MINLIKDETGFSCLAYSFAMVLGVEPRTIFSYLGHDGSDVLFPHLEGVARRRGFHPQEMIDFALTNTDKLVVPWELNPSFVMSDGSQILEHKIPRSAMQFYNRLRGRPAVIEFLTRTSRHAVASDGETIYDPSGVTYPLRLDYRIVNSYLVFSKSNL